MIKCAASFYNARKKTIFYIKDIDGWEKDPDIEKLLPNFVQQIDDAKDLITVVIAGEDGKLKRFFRDYPKMYHQICQHHLYVKGMKEATLADNILKKLQVDLKVPKETEDKILRFVQQDYPNNTLKNYDYIRWLVDKLRFDHYGSDFYVGNELLPDEIPTGTPVRSYDEIMHSLNEMIGLHQVKEQMAKINAQIVFRKNMGDTGADGLMHFIFSGNAGTGKTTVAKLLAEILYNIGYIEKNLLVSCSVKDLIGEWLGQTAPKTAKKCQEAYGGILFIDEAYGLISQKGANGNIYCEEAVNELIQQMENNRSRLMVIFAGYPAEMEEFVRTANPGLCSRISQTLVFEDYTVDELMEIFNKMVDKKGVEVDPTALQTVRSNIAQAKLRSASFGNARYARKLFDQIYQNHAMNVMGMDPQDPQYRYIVERDIPTSVLL